MFAPVALAEDEGGDKTDPGKPGTGLLVADDTLGGSVHIENYGWAEGVKLGNTVTFAQFDGSVELSPRRRLIKRRGTRKKATTFWLRLKRRPTRRTTKCWRSLKRSA